jgi:hypothetical protein
VHTVSDSRDLHFTSQRQPRHLAEGLPSLLLLLLLLLLLSHRAKSTSHMHHCLQTSVEEAQTSALLKEQTRIRTMGFPRKVTVKGFTRPLSSTAALGSTGTASAGSTGALQDAVHGSSGSSGSRRPAVRASEMIDTQKSKVPLKWAASNLVPPCSTYTSAHGTNPGQSPQVCDQHLVKMPPRLCLHS